jgi:DNA-binding NarL/FixJ family response regulator
VILSALEAGDYVFKVKGANSGGVWNEAGASVRIHVMGPSRLLTAALAFAGGLVLLAALAVLIRRLRRGSVPIKREVNWDKISRDYKITKREQEILGLILEGKRNEDIAQALFISGGTVRIHLSHIYQKLNVKNRQQAINLIIIS